MKTTKSPAATTVPAAAAAATTAAFDVVPDRAGALNDCDRLATFWTIPEDRVATAATPGP